MRLTINTVRRQSIRPRCSEPRRPPRRGFPLAILPELAILTKMWYNIARKEGNACSLGRVRRFGFRKENPPEILVLIPRRLEWFFFEECFVFILYPRPGVTYSGQSFFPRFRPSQL